MAYPGDAGQGCVRSDESVGSIAQFLHFLLGEAVYPLLRVVLVVFGVPHRLASDLFGEFIVRLELIEVGFHLPAGFDTVREDVW